MNNRNGDEKLKQILLGLNTDISKEIQSVTVVVGIGAVAMKDDLVWYQTYFSFPVSVVIDSNKRLLLDEKNYDNYIKNNIDFEDVLINKTTLNNNE